MRELTAVEMIDVSGGFNPVDAAVGAASSALGRSAATAIIGGFLEGLEVGSFGGPLAMIGGAAVGAGIGVMWYYTTSAP
ncbi:TPA: hypothetical protein HH295_07125 [Xanthomonas vasicola pv. zeae]|uniref:Bacteriocin n=1 Tax=Xanthomonas vasicola TaxID=56459 RepID=A0ABD7S4M7_XANVA|nr:hypothetical protein [Xanthomonas vasicola]MBV6745390.1 hypothetical protein [Xanthomonas vasicola pv. vasculorum NCPPB 890]MBV6890794.1 hypothetical protein [Xanthomonas vasicola pv. vasculorum]MDO6946306.1 hypothetical protein [Xanthomonas vasicola]MDO6950920.1 hypothetical protein [Xanthomonas vasicola]MDO6954831.1 hypothetical protein [Xanthomonas vasicola]